jgi:hypothetical protein
MLGLCLRLSKLEFVGKELKTNWLFFLGNAFVSASPLCLSHAFTIRFQTKVNFPPETGISEHK